MSQRRGRYGFVNRYKPEAFGMCDRGGEARKLSALHWEMRWDGDRLVRTGFRCCADHIDPPHPQDRIPPVYGDPQPVPDSRPPVD